LRPFLAFLTLFAACGGEDAAEQTYAAQGVQRLVIEATGPVSLSTGPGPEVAVGSPQPAEVVTDAKSMRVRAAPKAWLAIAAPAGLELVVRQAGAGEVKVEGEWGALTIKAEGPVSIAAAFAGGLVESRAGNVRCSLRGAIRQSLRLRAYRGKALDIEVTDAYRGLVNLATESGGIAVPNDPRFVGRREGQGKAIIGFVGKRWEGDELKGADKKPGIWATAPQGLVALTFAKR
jgi:hypothetical protein